MHFNEVNYKYDRIIGTLFDIFWSFINEIHKNNYFPSSLACF